MWDLFSKKDVVNSQTLDLYLRICPHCGKKLSVGTVRKRRKQNSVKCEHCSEEILGEKYKRY